VKKKFLFLLFWGLLIFLLSPLQALTPLPGGKDCIRIFFNLINEGRVADALKMMDEKAFFPDKAAKENWGKIFHSMTSVSIKNIEPSNTGEWTTNYQLYKVVLLIKMKPSGVNSPIHDYGWFNGLNTRWISLKKNQNRLWKIQGFATGP
jgi:hypothetical protein